MYKKIFILWSIDLEVIPYLCWQFIYFTILVESVYCFISNNLKQMVEVETNQNIPQQKPIPNKKVKYIQCNIFILKGVPRENFPS